MAEKKYDAWLEQFEREIGIKSSVIVYGNTNDLVFNAYKNGIHDSVVNTLIDSAKAKGYSKVIKWDRVDGIDTDTSDEITVFPSQERSGAQNVYDFGDDDLSSGSNKNVYKDPAEFFPFWQCKFPFRAGTSVSRHTGQNAGEHPQIRYHSIRSAKHRHYRHAKSGHVSSLVLSAQSACNHRQCAASRTKRTRKIF